MLCLFLLRRTDEVDWDETEALVVAVEDQGEARKIAETFSGLVELDSTVYHELFVWPEHYYKENPYLEKGEYFFPGTHNEDPAVWQTAECIYVGAAAEGVKKGIVLASIKLG